MITVLNWKLEYFKLNKYQQWLENYVSVLCIGYIYWTMIFGKCILIYIKNNVIVFSDVNRFILHTCTSSVAAGWLIEWLRVWPHPKSLAWLLSFTNVSLNTYKSTLCEVNSVIVPKNSILAVTIYSLSPVLCNDSTQLWYAFATFIYVVCLHATSPGVGPLFSAHFSKASLANCDWLVWGFKVTTIKLYNLYCGLDICSGSLICHVIYDPTNYEN